MKVTRTGHRALLPLLAAAIAACGGPQPSTTAPVATPIPAAAAPAPLRQAAPEEAAEEPLRLGGMVGDRPWNTTLDDFDWSPALAPDTADDDEAAPSAASSATASGGLSPAVQAADSGVGYGADIFTYDQTSGTVMALPGVNSGADEINPRVSANGRWLIYATDINGDWDIYLYDIAQGLIDTLSNLNTDEDEVAPTVDDDGTTIAYVFRRGGYSTLGLYDLVTDNAFVPTAVAQLIDDARTPWISGDGRYVAFASDVDYTGYDIFVYDVETATLISPPFVNSPDDEMDPALNEDGSRMVFATDRGGSDDIMLAEMTTGVLDRLVLANSPYDERSPRFLDGDGPIVFNTDRTGYLRLMVYHPGGGVLDTLAIAHEIGADDAMIDQSSDAGGIGGGLFGGSLGGLRGSWRSGLGRWW